MGTDVSDCLVSVQLARVGPILSDCRPRRVAVCLPQVNEGHSVRADVWRNLAGVLRHVILAAAEKAELVIESSAARQVEHGSRA